MRYLFILFFPVLVYGNSVKEEPLVFLHGMWARPWSLHYIEKHFKKAGYQVVNWGYPSLEKKIEVHAEFLVKELQIIASKHPGKPINFIAHSLGCLVLRSAVNHPECPSGAKMGKVILLTPPNQGSALARLLEPYRIARKVFQEESGRQILSGKDFKFLGDFPSSIRTLVIAGSRGFNPFIDGKSDGIIGVKETCLDTPHQHIVLKTGHASILVSRRAMKEMQEFLEKEKVCQNSTPCG